MVSTNSLRHSAVLLASVAAFQARNVVAQTSGSNLTAIVATPTTSAVVTDGITVNNLAGYSTKTYNASGAYSTYLPNNDFSDERLNFLWDQVC